MTQVKQTGGARSYELFGTTCDLGAARWELFNSTPGSKNYASTIRWDVKLPDDSLLTDFEHSGLLEALQLFIVSRVIDPRGTDELSAATCGSDGRALGVLARWMVQEGYRSLSEITAERTWDYVDFVVQDRERRLEDDVEDVAPKKGRTVGNALSHSTVWRDVNILNVLFNQRDAMRHLGAGSLTCVPYDGRSALSVVEKDLGLSRDGRLLPLPDDVAIPTLNLATRWLDGPSNDICALQELHENVRGLDHGTKRLLAYRSNEQLIMEYQFRTLEGEDAPWRGPVVPYTRVDKHGRTFVIKASQAVRRLVVQLQAACCIVIQGLTGIRAHELIGVEAEEELINGLPSCIEVETRRDGTVRKYYLRSKTFKGRTRSERWLLGASVVGTDMLPLPVRALLVLHALNDPWRKLGKIRSLLITFPAGQGFPRQKASVGQMTSSALSMQQKEFVAEHVDLSGASEQSQMEFSRGAGLRPHRWRTTFAIFVMRVSPQLVPALSDHYKHVNAVVTEEGYIGINPALREDIASARAQTSAENLLRLSDPNAVILGGGAKNFRENAEALRLLMEKEPGRSMYERALSLVERLELYVYDAAYGQCLSAFAPHLSRCNLLSGYAGQLTPFPNSAFRTVATCTQCELLVITPEHLPFFEERARTVELLLEQTSPEDEPGVHRYMQQRFRQAKQMVKLLGERSRHE